MNNFEQTTLFREVIETIENMNLTAIEKFALTNMISAYAWMSSYGISIDATYKDIIELFLDEIDGSYLHSKEERQHIDELLSKLN